jgi:hypothetical protein
MVISPVKVLKLSNRGSQTITGPLAFAEGLFYLELFYTKRRIFNIKSRIVIK